MGRRSRDGPAKGGSEEEKEKRAQSSAAHRGRFAERAIFINRKIEQRVKARVGDTRRLQAVAHVGSLERNNVHVEGSELETELHNDFFTPNSRPLALLCVGDRAAIIGERRRCSRRNSKFELGILGISRIPVCRSFSGEIIEDAGT
jgi:hypothetical protein